MYGCHNHIGCLSVSAYRIGSRLEVDAARLGTNLNILCGRIGKDINVGAESIGGLIDIMCNKIGKGLNITCSLVCSVNKDAYLKVMPDYVWLTPDMLSSAEFDIFLFPL